MRNFHYVIIATIVNFRGKNRYRSEDKMSHSSLDILYVLSFTTLVPKSITVLGRTDRKFLQ